MIKSMITPMASPMITPMIFSSSSDITRIFINLDDVATMYYETSAPITFGGDFEFTIELATTASSGALVFFGDSTGSLQYFLINGTTGVVDIKLPVNNNLSGSIVVNDGKLHIIKITQVSGVVSIIVDGVLDASMSGAGSGASFDLIGRNNLGNYFDGILANVSIKDLEIQNTIDVIDSQFTTYGDVTPTQSSPLASFTMSSVDTPDLAGSVISRTDAAINYWGGHTVESLAATYPKTLFRCAKSLSYDASERDSFNAGIEFVTDSSVFELHFYEINSALRLVVDGEYVGEYENTNHTGSLRYLKIDLSPLSLSAGNHTIRIEGDGNFAFGDIVLDAGATLTASAALGDIICFLGDSFTEGTGVPSERKSNSYAGIAAKQLGYNNYVSSGFGGSGWLLPYDPGFGTIRPNLKDRMQYDGVGADVYVIAMGFNDTDADITADINTTLDTLRAANSTEPVFVLSAWGDGLGGEVNGQINQSIVDAVDGRVGFYYVPVWQVSFTKSDASHPDEPGHKVLGDYISTRINALIATTTFELNEPTANSENSVEGNNTVIYNNIPTSVREDFTLVPGVEWLGAELWNDATTVIGSDWTDDGGGVYTINGSAGGLLQPFGDNITSYIRSTFDYTAVSGGLRVGNSGIITYSASGSRVVEGADATKFGFKRNTGTVVGELSNVTLKRLLTIA